MSQYDNSNRGVLFDNERKESDSHPDMTGTLNVNGVDHWFSAWWKNGQKGEFLSLSLGKVKEARGEQRQEPAQQPQRGNRPSNRQPEPARTAPKPVAAAGGFADMDSDVPF